MITKIHLIIVGPEDIIFYGEIDSVTFPGSAGSFTILPGHAPFISSLEKGSIQYKNQGEVATLEIVSGFMEVKQNRVSVCVRQ